MPSLLEQKLTQLRQAIKAHNFQSVSDIIQNNQTLKTALLTAKDKNGQTLLHLVAGLQLPVKNRSDIEEKDKKIINILLENGADITSKDKDGNTPLHLAAKAGNKEKQTLTLLIAESKKKNLGIDITNQQGNTPLHLALENINGGSAAVLIKHGADIYQQNNKNKTPIDLGKIALNRIGIFRSIFDGAIGETACPTEPFYTNFANVFSSAGAWGLVAGGLVFGIVPAILFIAAAYEEKHEIKYGKTAQDNVQLTCENLYLETQLELLPDLQSIDGKIEIGLNKIDDYQTQIKNGKLKLEQNLEQKYSKLEKLYNEVNNTYNPLKSKISSYQKEINNPSVELSENESKYLKSDACKRIKKITNDKENIAEYEQLLSRGDKVRAATNALIKGIGWIMPAVGMFSKGLAALATIKGLGFLSVLLSSMLGGPIGFACAVTVIGVITACFVMRASYKNSKEEACKSYKKKHNLLVKKEENLEKIEKSKQLLNVDKKITSFKTKLDNLKNQIAMLKTNPKSNQSPQKSKNIQFKSSSNQSKNSNQFFKSSNDTIPTKHIKRQGHVRSNSI